MKTAVTGAVYLAPDVIIVPGILMYVAMRWALRLTQAAACMRRVSLLT